MHLICTMVEQEYTLEEISYLQKEDCRIMEAVLSKWFSNPKVLNFISPNQRYPFNFKKWLATSYLPYIEEIKTIILKRNNLIIGHVSIRVKNKVGHVFHHFVDTRFRRRGFGKILLEEIESFSLLINAKFLKVKINEKNKVAKGFYYKCNFAVESDSSSNFIKMIKRVNI